jgi:hypothetical protein
VKENLNTAKDTSGVMNDNRFYTYAYLRTDRTPYYVGKGTGRRCYYNSGRRYCKVPKNKSKIIFLKRNLTEQEAFKHEVYMIAVFGRKDLGTGILRNRTNGGDGVSGAIRTQEWEDKRKEALKGKPGWNKGMKGVYKHSEDTIKKLKQKAKEGFKNGRIPPSLKSFILISPDGIEYEVNDGLKKFCNTHKISFGTMNDALCYGYETPRKNGWTIRRKNDNFIPTSKRYGNLEYGNKRKEFKLKNPEGKIVEGRNIKKFCFDNNLNYSCVSLVLNKKRKHHKGWTKP